MTALVRFVVLVAALLACWSFAAKADDDLPNFNAPTDNSPLNVDKVNRAFGLTVFKDPLLWDEDEAAVAKRLDWPEESRTSTQSSYRLYPTQKHPVNILGARAYSCVLYATQGKPTEISIVFVNEGDYEWTQNLVQAAKEKAQRLNPSDDSPDTSSTKAAPDTNAAPTNPTDLDSDTNSATDFEM